MKGVEGVPQRLWKEGDKCELPSRPVQHLSQSAEDKAMFGLFYKHPLKCGGTMVEIGALDGMQYSNSWFFEKALKWNTLLIEAQFDNYNKLVKNRPNGWNENTAMCAGGSGT